MEFEDILLDVGDNGKYQKHLILLFLVPAAIIFPWFSMNILFMLSVPDHWCNVPQVTSSNLSIPQQRSLVSPSDNPSCRMYDVNYTDVIAAGVTVLPNDTTTRPCNQGWQYDKTNYDYTAATVWNMVCHDDHYPSFILSMYSVGSIIATPIYGCLSDRIGRKPVFFVVIVVTAISALASVMTTSYTAFVVLKTINGGLMPSIFQLPFVIVLEIVAPEMRTQLNGVINCAWTVGFCFLPLIAYLSRNWITLGYITSSVTIIFFFYLRFLPESPRWLVSQEKYKEAVNILSQIAKKNGMKNDPEELRRKVEKLGERIKKEKIVDGVNNSPFDLLRYPQLRKKFLIISFCWTANINAYYGLQLNVTNLAGNEFLNFFLLSIVEAPGYLAAWVFMQKFGRRWCTVSYFMLTGIACFLPGLAPSDMPYMEVAASLIGKFTCAAAFMATYQQSSELYPTTLRSLALGMSSTLASTATLVVPYFVYLSIYGKFIPFLIIGFTSIIAAICAAFLPETLNENLPQTITDAEHFGLEQKFFSFNRRRLSLGQERRLSLALSQKEKSKKLTSLERGLDTLHEVKVLEAEPYPKEKALTINLANLTEMVDGILNTEKSKPNGKPDISSNKNEDVGNTKPEEVPQNDDDDSANAKAENVDKEREHIETPSRPNCDDVESKPDVRHRSAPSEDEQKCVR